MKYEGGACEGPPAYVRGSDMPSHGRERQAIYYVCSSSPEARNFAVDFMTP